MTSHKCLTNAHSFAASPTIDTTINTDTSRATDTDTTTSTAAE